MREGPFVVKYGNSDNQFNSDTLLPYIRVNNPTNARLKLPGIQGEVGPYTMGIVLPWGLNPGSFVIDASDITSYPLLPIFQGSSQPITVVLSNEDVPSPGINYGAGISASSPLSTLITEFDVKKSVFMTASINGALTIPIPSAAYGIGIVVRAAKPDATLSIKGATSGIEYCPTSLKTLIANVGNRYAFQLLPIANGDTQLVITSNFTGFDLFWVDCGCGDSVSIPIIAVATVVSDPNAFVGGGTFAIGSWYPLPVDTAKQDAAGMLQINPNSGPTYTGELGFVVPEDGDYLVTLDTFECDVNHTGVATPNVTSIQVFAFSSDNAHPPNIIPAGPFPAYVRDYCPLTTVNTELYVEPGGLNRNILFSVNGSAILFAKKGDWIGVYYNFRIDASLSGPAPLPGSTVLGSLPVVQSVTLLGKSIDLNQFTNLVNPMLVKGDVIYASDNNGTPSRLGLAATDGWVLTVSSATGLPVWRAPTGGFADPTTTKGDLIARGAAAPATRLPVGADGQTLIADSTQALGVRWGADTDFADPTTTKGDLIVRGAAAPATRLAVGADTQVLTADSTQALGVKWAAAGGGGFTPLSNEESASVLTAAGPVGISTHFPGPALPTGYAFEFHNPLGSAVNYSALGVSGDPVNSSHLVKAYAPAAGTAFRIEARCRIQRTAGAIGLWIGDSNADESHEATVVEFEPGVAGAADTVAFYSIDAGVFNTLGTLATLKNLGWFYVRLDRDTVGGWKGYFSIDRAFWFLLATHTKVFTVAKAGIRFSSTGGGATPLQSVDFIDEVS